MEKNLGCPGPAFQTGLRMRKRIGEVVLDFNSVLHSDPREVEAEDAAQLPERAIEPPARPMPMVAAEPQHIAVDGIEWQSIRTA